jgi:predicted transcriptional regulator
MSEKSIDTLLLTGEVVSAYVSNNSVSRADLLSLIESVHATLSGQAAGSTKAKEIELVPAVPVKKSITPDYIICLEDGKKFKSLRRHLNTSYGMTPEQYRAKWRLPVDYPMVAPNYAAARSKLAKKMGLGQARRKAEAPAAPARGGRARKRSA